MEQPKQSRISSWLSRAPAWQFSLYAIAVSFSTYFCMYGFRKAFSVARFEDQAVWIFDLKIALVISQIVGYTLAKYLGTKFCSEIQARNRAFAILLCIAGAETALVLYGILPGGWILAAIFLNGLSLGGVWGLVYGFLEGRKVSEILGAGLSCSYIIASGYAKTVGKSWLDEGVSEVWMPALTGACYLPFLIVAVWFLKQIPPPSGADVAERVLRKPMDSKDRWLFMKQFLPGLGVLFVVYFFLTAYRDFRDNFQIDICSDLGRDSEPMLLTATETPIGFIVVGGKEAIVENDNKLSADDLHARRELFFSRKALELFQGAGGHSAQPRTEVVFETLAAGVEQPRPLTFAFLTGASRKVDSQLPALADEDEAGRLRHMAVISQVEDLFAFLQAPAAENIQQRVPVGIIGRVDAELDVDFLEIR